MEAMVFAAGKGTRLRPITRDLPKALVQVGGRPMLGWVLDALSRAGVHRVVVNVHHHADQILRYLRENTPPGVEVVTSPEPDGPYDTGGGLVAAAPFFGRREPFLIHNVDVLSGISLKDLILEHAAATERIGPRHVTSLAVQDRPSSRRLLFDDLGLLGWESQGSDRVSDGRREVRTPAGEIRSLSFTGIHVVNPKVFDLSPRTGTFSIITLYLDLAAQGHVIHPLDVTGSPWLDVGTPQRLEEAERMVEGLQRT